MSKILMLCALCILCAPAMCLGWPAIVQDVADGDTLTVAPCGDTETPLAIRLYGIDAPEMAQSGGPEAAEYLRDLLPAGSTVEVINLGLDRYGRIVALIAHKGKVVNTRIVRDGHAWVYARYCKLKACKAWYRVQKEASDARRGLWGGDTPLPPWVWRQGKK